MIHAQTATQKRRTVDRTEPWLVGLVLLGCLAAAGALTLCWHLLTGGVA